MAQFDKEFNKLILNEGGYVNDPDDRGGETYLGISRKFNPTWRGWKLIDIAKKHFKIKAEFKKSLKGNTALTDLAKEYYKSHYWDILELDDIPNQELAHQMFDTCVNCGVNTAVRIAEQVMGMTITGKWSDELKYNLKKYEG